MGRGKPGELLPAVNKVNGDGIVGPDRSWNGDGFSAAKSSGTFDKQDAAGFNIKLRDEAGAAVDVFHKGKDAGFEDLGLRTGQNAGFEDLGLRTGQNSGSVDMFPKVQHDLGEAGNVDMFPKVHQDLGEAGAVDMFPKVHQDLGEAGVNGDGFSAAKSDGTFDKQDLAGHMKRSAEMDDWERGSIEPPTSDGFSAARSGGRLDTQDAAGHMKRSIEMDDWERGNIEPPISDGAMGDGSV
jgi:hypothetical protein